MDTQYRKKTLSQYCWDCGETIRDKYLLYALDRYWHTACLKCSICRITLADAGSSCYTRAGLILCRDDYLSGSTAQGGTWPSQEAFSRPAFFLLVFSILSSQN
ncbi:UNVERIFIED_CONTAM: lmo4-b [Trichonephila clavipes]